MHPDYQRNGVASALYEARLALIERFRLEGWYAGGMLMGYYRYREELTPAEYGRQVIAGELTDPTEGTKAAMRALALVESGMLLGLGTGSTARWLIKGLADKLARGELTEVAAVATSRQTETQAQNLGIEIAMCKKT